MDCLRILLFILLLASFGQPVLAQEEWSYTPDIPTDAGQSTLAPDPAVTLDLRGEQETEESILAKIAQLPPEIQDELVNEADQATQRCTIDYLMPQYYDCACVGFKFLQARYKEGPEKIFDNLFQGINYQDCLAIPTIAGRNYERCKSFMGGHPPGEMENVCSCVGRAMAEEYRKAGSAYNMRYVQNLLVPTMQACRINHQDPLQALQN